MTGPADLSRSERARVVAAMADRLGSEREARWIVDHAGVAGAEALVDRRLAGEPLQYVLGRWPFRSIELRVDPRVLIPRPETEQLVEVALSELARLVEEGDESDQPRRCHRLCVDLGTGSGAVALAMATEGCALCPGLEVWATDSSPDALEVARENICDLALTDPVGSERVRMVEGSWFDPLPVELRGHFDLVVSNPPYVAESEFPELDPSVRCWEPVEALVAPAGTGGVAGMAAIETIVAEAPGWLRRPGVLIVEIDPRQAVAAVDAARRAGFDEVRAEADLAGRLRMLVARCRR
jgi:release factor glutamine methyltransferase